MKKLTYLAMVILAVAVLGSCKSAKEEMTQELKDVIKVHDSLYIPLYKEVTMAYWNAAISGKPEDFAIVSEKEIAITAIFTDTTRFATLKKIKESNLIEDSILNRELIVLYNAYLGAQVDTAKLNAMIKLGNVIEQKYGNFRAKVKGKELTDNQIENILRSSTNSNELKDVWMAHKNIGPLVADDVKKLVKMRNEIAKELGFNNYHEMSLKLSEQDPAEIENLFNELDNLTRDAFGQVKYEIDSVFVLRYKVKKEELMPWHYQNRYFQEAPKLYEVDLDKYYEKQNIEELTRVYFDGIGLPIDDMLKNSDLYEKPGKNQHAFCTDIDNAGDVRVLCNIVPNESWMNTMLHEFGHAVYDKNISMDLPFILREPAHTFTTEAIAMIFGRMAKSPQWMKDVAGISEEEKAKISDICFKTLRLEQLVFSRWSQVMFRFEKGMYENPDQDLNQLWWDLVEKYQLVKKPVDRNEPDWATKIHIASSPCYYHNYLMGELLASQLFNYIGANVIKATDLKDMSFAGNPAVGEYLKKKVFEPGLRYYWNDMIEKATGEKLTAKYYANQFVNK